MEQFNDIYLDLSKQPGRCRIGEPGVGWKPSGDGETFQISNDHIYQAHWSRASKGFEIKILLNRGSAIHQLDGFQQDDFDRAARAFKDFYQVPLENKEHTLRGWNWGKGDFGRAEMTFNVQNRPAFEIPYTEIANANLAGRNEIAVDFSLPANGEETGTNGALGGARSKGKKSGAARDQLVEARFYIPGTVLKKEKKEDGEEVSDDEEAEEQNAANTWYETLMAKAEIGEVAGDTLASFIDMLHLTPRGRFDMDMYESSFRLRGKTYDYKIQYDHIKKFFVLPKPDDVHVMIVIGLDPPLQQGQTRYPFLVMQFKRDEELSLDVNMTEDDMKNKYKTEVKPHYEGPIYSVITGLFKAIAGKKIISPSKDFHSRHQQSGVKCSIKANEGHLFFMDKSFLFVPKPATYIASDQISVITMSRVGGAISASRTFDVTMSMKTGIEHHFSNINREEQQPLEDFFRLKNIKVRNEMMEDNTATLAKALKDQDIESSDEEVVGADRGSADEDSESDDEDFKADSDTDVAEEFDSAHESSGGDSDAEMADAAGSGDERPEPPKKKTKTKK